MKKRIFSVLLAVVMLACVVIALCINSGAAYTYGDWIYDHFDSTKLTASIKPVNPKGLSGIVTVPSSVEHQGKTYTVTTINYQAFNNASNVTKIVLPNTITSIYGEAFLNCSSLTSMNLEETQITNMSNTPFKGCDSLTSVTLPDTFGSLISSYPSKEDVYFRAINFNAGSNKKIIVNIEDGNQYYQQVGDVIYTKDGKELLYNNSTAITSFEIPNDVEKIGPYAFYNCSYLKMVSVPDSVIYINDYAFYNCASLENFDMPSGLQSIGAYAFYNCTNLGNVNMPSGLHSIGIYAFRGCSSFTEVDLSNTVLEVLRGGAFCGCAELEKVVFPSTTTTINGSAFMDCKKLKEVIFPENSELTKIPGNGAWAEGGIHNQSQFLRCSELVTLDLSTTKLETVEWGVLGDCDNLESIKLPASFKKFDINGFIDKSNKNITISFPNGNSYFEIRDDGAIIDKNNKELVYFNIKPTGETYDIPDGVTKLGESIFNGFDNLKTIDLTGITNIGRKAFSGCTGLTSIIFSNSIEKVEPYAFDGCTNLRQIYIPQQIKATYSGNGVFNNIAQGAVFTVKDLAILSFLDQNREIATTSVAYTNGGDLIGPLADKANELTPAESFAKWGYIPKGWYDNAGFTGNPVTSITAGNKYFLKWELDPNFAYVNYSDGIDPANDTEKIIVEKFAKEGNKYTLEQNNTFTKRGFLFDGWKLGDVKYAAGDSVEIVADDNTFTAVWKLTKGTVSGATNKVYDGEAVVLTAEHIASGAKTYQWYKLNGSNETLLEGKTEATLSLVNVADSGSYCCKITIGNDYAYTEAASVTINPIVITVTAKNQVISKGENFALSEDVLNITGRDLTTEEKAALIRNLAVDVPGFSSTVAGRYNINLSCVADWGTIALLGNYSFTLASGEGIIKDTPIINLSLNNPDNYFYTGDSITPGITVNATTGGMFDAFDTNSITITYWMDVETQEQRVYSICDAGEYIIKANYAGSEYYEAASAEVKLTVKPANVIISVNKSVQKGTSMAEVNDDICREDFDIEYPDNLSNEAVEFIEDFVDDMFAVGFLMPQLNAVDGVVESLISNGITLYFQLDPSTRIDIAGLTGAGMNPIDPAVAKSLGLPSEFQNYSIMFEEGDLVPKTTPTITFVSAGVFTINDVEYSDKFREVDKALVTEFTADTIQITSNNIVINGDAGGPVPTGEITIEYRYTLNDADNEEDLFFVDDYPLAPGDWVARITVAEDDNYFESVAYVLVRVQPARLIVSAENQEISVYGDILTDESQITLSGAILGNDMVSNLIFTALSDLVDAGVIRIELADTVDITEAGEYPNGIKIVYDPDKLSDLPPEFAEMAAAFNIKTVPGDLTIITENTYTVTLNYGEYDQETITVFDPFTEPEAKLIGGKIFMGWYDDAEMKDLHDFTQPITSDITLYAKYADYDEEINSKIEKVNEALTALKDSLGDTTSLTGTIVENITKLQTSIDTLNANYATADTALQVQITALNEKVTKLIDETIAKLTERVTKLEENLTAANGKIDTNSSDIATLKTDVAALKSWQTQAKDAISTLQNLTASQGASIADLQTAVASLQTAVDAATSNITAAIDRIAILEGKVSALETAKTQLEADIAALQSAVDTKAEAQALTAAINSLNASITEAKAYAESQDAALKTLLEAADATINTAIGELKSKISALESGLSAANDKIDTNSSNIETLKTDVAALKTWQTEAQAAIDSLESLSATKVELEAAVTELKAALKTANDNISAAIKRIEDLEGKVEDLEKDAEALEKAVSELKAAMTSTTEALAKEIKDLNTALEAAKKTAAEGDAELKKAIETAETALKAAVGELEGRVAVIESVLSAANANINTNTTDIATLKANIKTIEMLQSEAEKTIKALGTLIGTNEENIAELQTSVTKLQESVYAADTKIAAAEARIAVLEGKVEELEGVKNELQASVANLQAALATKADREAVNNAVAALQASISALQSAQNNYIFADMTLKNELTAAINAAKELAISTAKDLVSQSATELRAAIDKKADSATLEAKAAELAEAIVLAETASKAYADAQDALLKEALDAELLAANELIASLGIRMTDAEAAIDALESAVEVLQKVTADDAQALKDAVASLSQALADAKALAAESDTAIETALGLVISEAQKALEAKISDVQSGLNKAIKDLKAADASNADELKKAIKSIEDAMAAAESARDAADNALESKLTEAQTELTRKIAEVQANLDTAKTELGKAIESGDTALGEKIKELNEALEAAKAATEASDVTLKTELTAKIDEADAAIYALIEKLQKELQESNVELNTAIEEGDDELNTQFIISTSVAGVGVAGNIGLLAWIIISKKRRLF